MGCPPASLTYRVKYLLRFRDLDDFQERTTCLFGYQDFKEDGNMSTAIDAFELWRSLNPDLLSYF